MFEVWLRQAPFYRVTRGLCGVRTVTASLVAIGLAACSLSETTQRINVDYNYTIEGITNELTLLNIVRAKEGLPLHYTSVQRLTGSVTVKATGGFNAAVKTGAPTDTTGSMTAVGPMGSTVTNSVSRAILSGGTVYTPAIGGEVDTGPSFDVNILDTQAFYQGILSGIPFSTVNALASQGYDRKLLTSLLVEKVEFRQKDDKPGLPGIKGDLIHTINSSPSSGPDSDFAHFLKCYTLTSGSARPTGTPIAPFSRVTSSRTARSLTLEDLVLLDGTKLDLSSAVSENPAKDGGITIFRPPSNKDIAQLPRAPSCTDPVHTLDGKEVSFPPTPPPDPFYAGSGKVMVLTKDRHSGVLVDADIAVTFRSPEGLIQFVGDCLARQSGATMTCRIGDQVLFVLHRGSSSDALVSASLLGERYYIANDEFRRRTLSVISLIERLVNLQKSSTDRPVTVPVQVVP
jgi:hypothetical protein